MPPLRPLIESLDGQAHLAEFAAWAGTLDDDPLRLWRECPKGDWLLWLLAALGAELRPLVRSACECARLAEVVVPSSEPSPRLTVASAQAWLEGYGEVEPCLEAGDEAALLASSPGVDEFVRASALSSFWLSRLLSRAADRPAPALDGSPADAATEARLALFHAAAASALEVAHHEADAHDWLARCLDAARLRCADIVRETVAFDLLLTALP